MQITFLGGADEVGASSILIETGGRRLLVDAGIRPSPKARWGLAGDQLPDLSAIERGGGLDAVLVTHAHTDHTGALELVTGRFPGVPVYATPPTIALTRILHLDSRRIMQSRLDEEGELPLFDDVAVTKLMSAFVSVPFHTRLPLAEGLVMTFFPAGHIAGAAMIGLESDDGRILITGDISISPQRTVDGARPPAFRPDVLIMESTYGGRLHANRIAEERRLVETVGEVVAGGGKVLIPAFALGRAQELLLILGEFRRRGELPTLPVWADGMVRAICQAYTSFAEVLPLPLQERGARFFEEGIRPVERSEQRNALVWSTEPAVIVASSGMLAGGPSLAYARALAGAPQHAILLTGYQDEEAPGRRLQEVAARGHGSIRLGKDKVDVQCRLGTYSLSAHADEAQLISLVETLDPAEVLLVHGDEEARASLRRSLSERGRSVSEPRSGQTFQYRFAPAPLLKGRRAIGAGRPLDLAGLWEAVAAPESGPLSGAGVSISPYYTLQELARLWWGEAESGSETLAAAIEEDDLYFIPDPRREAVYRARPQAQVERILRRRGQMQDYAQAAGRWLIVRRPPAAPLAARCVAVERDHLLVAPPEGDLPAPDAAAGEPLVVYPEDVLAMLGEAAPTPAELQRYAQPAVPGLATHMEPNQALAYTNAQFPPEARLRKAGYRIDSRSLVLTFDFPLAARVAYADLIERLAAATGWQVEINPETNLSALSALVSSLLPPGWQVIKGPSVFQEQKRVAITAAPDSEGAGRPRPRQVADEMAERFQAASGYELSVTLNAPLTVAPAGRPAPTAPPATPLPAGQRMEINAAYATIKAELAGSTLYRTSLKGDTILLSFISAPVGERYREMIAALAERTGWPLEINPQPNQGAILEAARSLLAEAGLQIQKGPGIYPERREVATTLVALPAEEEAGYLVEEFERQTGYRLALNAANAPAAPGRAAVARDAVEIPVERIRLRPYHQSLSLNPDKLNKAIERARRDGLITPPVTVRRTPNGYILMDGLYRLAAAQALNLTTILAEVE